MIARRIKNNFEFLPSLLFPLSTLPYRFDRESGEKKSFSRRRSGLEKKITYVQNLERTHIKSVVRNLGKSSVSTEYRGGPHMQMNLSQFSIKTTWGNCDDQRKTAVSGDCSLSGSVSSHPHLSTNLLGLVNTAHSQSCAPIQLLCFSVIVSITGYFRGQLLSPMHLCHAEISKVAR